MKKELFNKLIDAIMAQPKLYKSHKVTYTEQLEVHTFASTFNIDLSNIKSILKEHGYKSQDAYQKMRGKTTNNSYLTILYSKDNDKISISMFQTGYAHSYNKGRFYPLRKNTPLFSWTKHMYSLLSSRGKGPRIQKGPISLYGFFPGVNEIITKTLLQIDYIPNAYVSYRHIIGTNNDWEALGNMFGVRIPQALHKFYTDEVLSLYKTIKDFNEINTLCQFMAKDSRLREVEDIDWDFKSPSTIPMDLYQTIAKMLFGDHTMSYLVRDYIGDNLSLKTRNVSLKVKSVKRWQDEHQKASIKRMLKGVPEIRVDKVYEKALEGLEYPYELITTKNRLVQESVELHHCVGTYAMRINSGECAIFSVEYEGKRWTLQVNAHKFKDGVVFKPIQFRGLCNTAAPDKIGNLVAEILAKNSGSSEGLVIPQQRHQIELL